MPEALGIPRWAVMWLLAFGIFCGCKLLTWARCGVSGAGPLRHAGYLLAWPGLDASAFLSRSTGQKVQPPTSGEWALAACRTLLGLLILYGGVKLVPADRRYACGWVGMLGLILVLHFGLFHLMSCGWRRAGVAARPLMDRPLAATSLSAFWGRRWNTAFRDLTHRYLFRPLLKRFRPATALLVGFGFSGLVHDLVISLPAGGGYGGPTVYFLLQGLGLLTERSGAGRRLGLGSGAGGWGFAMAVVALPVPLLFHRPFVVGIILPFLAAIGAKD